MEIADKIIREIVHTKTSHTKSTTLTDAVDSTPYYIIIFLISSNHKFKL